LQIAFKIVLVLSNGYHFVLLFFRQNLSNWSRWKLKNVRSLLLFMKTIQFPSNLKLKITLFVKPF